MTEVGVVASVAAAGPLVVMELSSCPHPGSNPSCPVAIVIPLEPGVGRSPPFPFFPLFLCPLAPRVDFFLGLTSGTSSSA